MPYEIKLPVFEGPFDLLLFFIERDELDIYDIPLAKVTDDFFHYIHRMESMNIELASEFMLVAATLMRIKAKMLLPRRELDEKGEEIDPRQELVERLLEYKKYKAVLDELRDMEENRSRQVSRGNLPAELAFIADEHETGAELHSLTLYKLLSSFQAVLKKHEEGKKKVEHTVVNYNYTIKGQKEYLIKLVSRKGKARFTEIFDKCENRIHAIFSFLALLELIQQQVLRLTNSKSVNSFELSLVSKTS